MTTTLPPPSDLPEVISIPVLSKTDVLLQYIKSTGQALHTEEPDLSWMHDLLAEEAS